MEQRGKNKQTTNKWTSQTVDALPAACFTAIRSSLKMFTRTFQSIQGKILKLQKYQLFLRKSLLGGSGKFADLYRPLKIFLKRVKEISMASQGKSEKGRESVEEPSLPSMVTSYVWTYILQSSSRSPKKQSIALFRLKNQILEVTTSKFYSVSGAKCF